MNGGNGGKILAFYSIPLDIQAMKAALVKGPLYVGLYWDAAWFKCPVTLMLRPPVGQIVGGHAVYLWGWDDNANGGSWLLRNSWGKPWDRGNGNAYMRYEWFADHAFEAWLTTDVIGD
jgi:C1A family cysteine protease